MTAAKAVWGGVVAFVAPGAIYVAANAGDGMSGNEWLIAAALCFVPAGAVGATVFYKRNANTAGALADQKTLS